MVGDSRLIRARRAGGEDGQVAVDLQGIGVDDFAADLARQAQGQG